MILPTVYCPRQRVILTCAEISEPDLSQQDHFGLILNEPAGKIAQVLVEHSVNLIVQAWSNNDNIDNTINQVSTTCHHTASETGA